MELDKHLKCARQEMRENADTDLEGNAHQANAYLSRNLPLPLCIDDPLKYIVNSISFLVSMSRCFLKAVGIGLTPKRVLARSRRSTFCKGYWIVYFPWVNKDNQMQNPRLVLLQKSYLPQ